VPIDCRHSSPVRTIVEFAASALIELPFEQSHERRLHASRASVEYLRE
jgi:hypothetical protein